MKKCWLLFLVLSCTLLAQSKDWTQYVNPLMGTQSSFELSTGNTYPTIARPWGMNFWTPQTGKMGDGWQYVYTANKIRGFKQTHQPSPWINDYGQFSIMPMVGKPEFDEEKRASWFGHKGEEATPYYYKVYLAEYDIVTEMSPTERAVLFRFTFPENAHSYIAVDAFDKGSFIQIIPEENKIIGYSTRNSGGVPENFKNYFIIQFDKPFTYKATVNNGSIQENATEQTTDHAGAIIGFKTQRGEQVHARIASSFISFEQAARNMKELGNDNLEQIKQKGQKAWNQVLGKIEVEGGNLDQYRTFYSCLYRSLLFPRKFHELDEAGKPVHYSPYNGQVLPGYMFTDTGFWDTFRCLFPLLNLMYPSMNKEMQEGLINTYKESGFFPEWASPGHRDCMIGNNSASVLADAYLKGIKVEDVKTLYEGLIHGTKNVHPTVSSTGRRGYEYYNKLGYVPYDVKINENTARTLEYAYNDWCIYQLAKELKRPEKEIQLFAKRAMNYKNVFDPSIGFMRGKGVDGKWQEPFDPLEWGGPFCEGNAWHYTWSVFHDVEGLIDLFGSDQKFTAKMDSVFALPGTIKPGTYGGVIHEMKEMELAGMGQYAHGNQPIQHMPYLYSYAGQPWKTQYWVRQIVERLYNSTERGYPGDEDQGGMSSWYILSSLGIYAVCPGTDEYVIGSPLFKKATITMENGNKFVIEANNNSKENLYIQSATLNGRVLDKNFIRYDDIADGGIIRFEMGSQPNKERCTSKYAAPFSLSKE